MKYTLNDHFYINLHTVHLRIKPIYIEFPMIKLLYRQISKNDQRTDLAHIELITMIIIFTIGNINHINKAVQISSERTYLHCLDKKHHHCIYTLRALTVNK